MSDLVVIVCRTVSQAEEVRRQLSNLQVEYRVALDDVAIVNRTEAGEIRSTIS
jgi:Predicted membrane protein